MTGDMILRAGASMLVFLDGIASQFARRTAQPEERVKKAMLWPFVLSTRSP